MTKDSPESPKEILLKLWVKSAPDSVGQYLLYLEYEYSEDAESQEKRLPIPLDKAGALKWAQEVMSAVARAEYDAALVAQYTAMNTPLDDIASVVRDVRADRAPLSCLPPDIELDPSVTATGQPYLSLRSGGKVIGEWTMADGRQHVLDMMEAVVVTELDGQYLGYRTETVGLDGTLARNVVAGLYEGREQRLRTD